MVEQLGFVRLKRLSAMHIIIIPCLMAGHWRKHLNHGTDRCSKLDDDEVWDLNDQFEPLLIYFCLPFCSENPRRGERSDLLAPIQQVLFKPDVQMLCSGQRRDILRLLLLQARGLCPM